MNREKIYLFLVIILLVVFGVTSSRAIWAVWQAPAQSPLDTNSAAPLNQGIERQAKNGPLIIGKANHGNRYGLEIKNGIAYFQGGLKLELRDSDPSGNPNDLESIDPLTDGRIWIRSDLP